MQPKTHIYTVYLKAGDSQAYLNPEFVREGFSWPAFLLTFFWAFYHKLWISGLAMLAFTFFSVWMQKSDMLSEESCSVVILAFHLIVGLHANDWLRTGLKHRGYLLSDISTGNSLLLAQQRFYERFLAARPS
jgi:hypothetical protein